MANIREVAKKAGVSVATVSRVLNHPESVSPKTTEQVLMVIKELQFTPNGLARSLALSRSNTIALLVPNILNPLYPQIAKGVEDVTHQKGYNILLCNTEDSHIREAEYIDMLLEKRVDGFILTASQLPHEELKKISEAKIPLVLIDNNENHQENIVYTDYILGGYLATQHLIEIGYKKIAHITGPLRLKENNDKYLGYLKALGENDIAPIEQLVINGDNEVEGGYIAAKKLISLPNPPDAIFAANDLMAIGAIDAIKAEGYKIPKDIAVVGFDDIRMASLIEPKLTTVSQPVYKMGLIAARILFDCIENNDDINYQQKIYIQPKLMVRKSCGHEDRLREIFN